VVTGRPWADCNTFLQTHGIASLFDACVCMEDGPPKPDAFPVARACQLLGVDPKETLMVRSGFVFLCVGWRTTTRPQALTTTASHEPNRLGTRSTTSARPLPRGPCPSGC